MPGLYVFPSSPIARLAQIEQFIPPSDLNQLPRRPETRNCNRVTSGELCGMYGCTYVWMYMYGCICMGLDAEGGCVLIHSTD